MTLYGDIGVRDSGASQQDEDNKDALPLLHKGHEGFSQYYLFKTPAAHHPKP